MMRTSTKMHVLSASVFAGRFPSRFLKLALALTAAALGWIAWNAHASYISARDRMQRDFRIAEVRGEILHLDEVLTMSARLFAATGDTAWEARYRAAEPRLDGAIKEAIRLAPEVTGSEAAKQTDAANRRLIEMESRAFGLVRAGRPEEAQALLVSKAYEMEKVVYSEGMAGFGVARDLPRRLVELGGAIMHHAEVLGMSVRMAAATGDALWGERYRAFEPRLKAVMNEAVRLSPYPDAKTAAARVAAARAAVANTEARILQLSREARTAEAQAILGSDAYASRERQYEASMVRFQALLRGTGAAALALDRRRAFFHIAAVVVVSAAMLVGWLVVLGAMRRWRTALLDNHDRLARQARKLDDANTSLGRQRALLSGINAIFRETLTCETEEDVARTCLRVAEDLTGSRFGFVGEINARGRFDTIALSDPGWRACRMPESDAARLIKGMEVRGMWGEVIRQERALVVNDPGACPHRVGTPTGHPAITAFLGVPLTHADTTFGMIALANRAGGYSSADREDIETLSVAFVEALNRARRKKSVARQADELKRLNRELEAFCYSVSHDLRAPLRAMTGFSQILLSDHSARLDQQGKHYLERIDAACNRMGRLIDDLLELSRVARQELKREPIDLSAVARAVSRTLQEHHPERQVTFAIQDGLVASGDPQLVQIALQNLLSNAWKFTGRHPQARIEFGATEEDGIRTFHVRDDGAGFDMAHVKKLFGPFQRLHSEHEFSGTGIGLATVQRIIHRHGGHIWAEGAVEQGAAFHFTLRPGREWPDA